MFRHADSIAAGVLITSTPRRVASCNRCCPRRRRAAYGAKVRRLGSKIRRDTVALRTIRASASQAVSDRVLGRDHHLQTGRFLEEFHSPLADFVATMTFMGSFGFRLQAATYGQSHAGIWNNQLKGERGVSN